MLTKIADNLYMDLSKVTYLSIEESKNECMFVIDGEIFTASAETGELIRYKLDEYLGLKP